MDHKDNASTATIAQYLNLRGAAPGVLSPDGTRMLFFWTVTGTPQIWLLDRPLAWPRQVTFFPDRVMGAQWTPNGQGVLLTSDVGGSEKSQIFFVSPDGSGLRRLTGNDEAIHTVGEFHPDGRTIAYAANDRNGRDFDLYLLDTQTGEARKVLEAEGANYPVAFTRDGARLLFARHNANVDNDLFLLDVSTGKTTLLTPHEGDAQFRFAGWTEDGQGLYLATNKDRDFINRAYLNLSTGELRVLAEENADTDAFAVSRDGRMMAYIVNQDGYGNLHVADVATGMPVTVQDLPRGVTFGLRFAHDPPFLSVSVTSGTRIGTAWRIDLGSGLAREWTASTPAGVNTQSFVEPQLIRYRSFDGLEIPAFVYVPHGAAQADGTLPFVLDIHGGPESQERPDFNPVIQYLVSRGYGVLAPNIRGSTGYGKAYTHLDDVEKRLDSIQDIAAGADWLAESGWADRTKIAVMGGSYGGYAALASLVFHPEKWAAGISIVGISNLLTFLQNTGAYRRKLRAAEYGDPERDAEFLRSASPFYHIERIRAPLLVIQGANDPRVPQSESDQIVEAVRTQGGEVEYLLFPDEGHGVVKLSNRIISWTAVADFLDKRLQSRR